VIGQLARVMPDLSQENPPCPPFTKGGVEMAFPPFLKGD
jgi:hypothetical protein